MADISNWEPGRQYKQNDRVWVDVSRGKQLWCVRDGMSGTSPIPIKAKGAVIYDGTVKWITVNTEEVRG